MSRKNICDACSVLDNNRQKQPSYHHPSIYILHYIIGFDQYASITHSDQTKDRNSPVTLYSVMVLVWVTLFTQWLKL